MRSPILEMLLTRLMLTIVTIARTQERKIIMAILSRLAALEAALAAQAEQLAGLQHPTDGVASQADVAALGARVDAIEAEIGTDPAPAPSPQP